MIVGITGLICAGKKTIVKYLKETYDFEAINLEEIFKAKLKELLEVKKAKR